MFYAIISLEVLMIEDEVGPIGDYTEIVGED